MNCPEFEKLNLYIDGELNTDVASELEVHLATCSECRLFVEQTIASEELMRNKIHRYIEINSVKTAVLDAIKREQITSTSPKAYKAYYFRLAFASVFSIMIALFWYSIYNKPNISNTYNINSIQSSNSNSFIDGKPLHHLEAFKGSLSEYHHYSGAFVFNVGFKEQVSKLSWIGSGTLLISPKGEIEFQSGEGKLELLSGEKINSKFKKDILIYKQNAINLKKSDNNCSSTIVKKIMKKPFEANIASNSISNAISNAIITQKKTASASIFIASFSSECIDCKTIHDSHKQINADTPLSSFPVFVDNDVSTSVTTIEKTKNPFETNVIKLSGGQE